MYQGDFEQLFLSIRNMKTQMVQTLRSIEESSRQVSAGAANLADASQNLAEGATEQAGAVEELQVPLPTLLPILSRLLNRHRSPMSRPENMQTKQITAEQR